MVIMMDGSVEHVFKNIRYKILCIDGEYYILDMDKPAWAIIFPFIYWFLPHTVYKIDYYLLEELNMPIKKQGSKGWIVALGTGVSIFLTQLITPNLSNFNSETSTILKGIALVISIAVIISIRLFIYNESYKKIDKIIRVKSLNKTNIKIRPTGIKSYLQLFFFFFFFLALSILGAIAFLEFGNYIILLCFISLTIAFLGMNTLVIPPGFVKVTFLENSDET